MTFSRIFIFFIIYSVIGWMCEVVYCSVIEKRLVNRGFLHGPLCPVYGFGGLLVLNLLTPWADSYFPLFIAAAAVTSVLEYATSWLLEKLFNTKWWDYSSMPLNIHGRVCLLNSVLFGVLGVAAVHIVHPFAVKIINLFSEENIQMAASILAAVLTIDFLFTLRKLVDFNSYVVKLQEFSDSLRERFNGEEWFNNKSISEIFDSVRERGHKEKAQISHSLLNRIEFFSERKKEIESIFQKFPTISSVSYRFTFDHIKDKIDERISKIRSNKE